MARTKSIGQHAAAAKKAAREATTAAEKYAAAHPVARAARDAAARTALLAHLKQRIAVAKAGRVFFKAHIGSKTVKRAEAGAIQKALADAESTLDQIDEAFEEAMGTGDPSQALAACKDMQKEAEGMLAALEGTADE